MLVCQSSWLTCARSTGVVITDPLAVDGGFDGSQRDMGVFRLDLTMAPADRPELADSRAGLRVEFLSSGLFWRHCVMMHDDVSCRDLRRLKLKMEGGGLGGGVFQLQMLN